MYLGAIWQMGRLFVGLLGMMICSLALLPYSCEVWCSIQTEGEQHKQQAAAAASKRKRRPSA
ncbi:hypothetical protein JMJ77_0002336 [Colletotrichum scovillei]|uniref:Uncharacterized protein n=1 Tax=Colletotrichum scovillei TaxID=1209932 RepID=A0A9P7RB48_9PEZI|nr:hypothetical protein JMJ77_0002336 [Colletotrichum scovillei]KAG7070756.1 hypothetical protein JMJ76_0002002 [Colletotrichum scovillei]KAG7078990.1 hypothetical protein JMJ78_0002652 [Colletotrichum scovillei]